MISQPSSRSSVQVAAGSQRGMRGVGDVIGRLPVRGHLRGADDQGHPRAALVEAALAVAEGSVVGRGDFGFRVDVVSVAAVVRMENDHRVVGDPALFEHLRHGADGVDRLVP